MHHVYQWCTLIMGLHRGIKQLVYHHVYNYDVLLLFLTIIPYGIHLIIM